VLGLADGFLRLVIPGRFVRARDLVVRRTTSRHLGTAGPWALDLAELAASTKCGHASHAQKPNYSLDDRYLSSSFHVECIDRQHGTDLCEAWASRRENVAQPAGGRPEIPSLLPRTFERSRSHPPLSRRPRRDRDRSTSGGCIRFVAANADADVHGLRHQQTAVWIDDVLNALAGAVELCARCRIFSSATGTKGGRWATYKNINLQCLFLRRQTPLCICVSSGLLRRLRRGRWWWQRRRCVQRSVHRYTRPVQLPVRAGVKQNFVLPHAGGALSVFSDAAGDRRAQQTEVERHVGQLLSRHSRPLAAGFTRLNSARSRTAANGSSRHLPSIPA